jgi:hypothetical protein
MRMPQPVGCSRGRVGTVVVPSAIPLFASPAQAFLFLIFEGKSSSAAGGSAAAHRRGASPRSPIDRTWRSHDRPQPPAK